MKELVSQMIEAARQYALMVIKRHEEMCKDLGLYCDDLTIEEREHWIKEHEDEHYQWQFRNDEKYSVLHDQNDR